MYANERRIPYRACQNRDSFLSFMRVLGIPLHNMLMRVRKRSDERTNRGTEPKKNKLFEVGKYGKNEMSLVNCMKHDELLFIMIAYKCTPIPAEHGIRVHDSCNRAMTRRHSGIFHSVFMFYFPFQLKIKLNCDFYQIEIIEWIAKRVP